MTFSSEQYVKFLRDLGIIFGFPTLVVVGIYFYQSYIKALKAQIDLLKETQYDKALSLIKAQKEVYEIEREKLHNDIKKLISEKETRKKLSDEINLSFNNIENKTEKLLKRKWVIRIWDHEKNEYRLVKDDFNSEN